MNVRLHIAPERPPDPDLSVAIFSPGYTLRRRSLASGLVGLIGLILSYGVGLWAPTIARGDRPATGQDQAVQAPGQAEAAALDSAVTLTDRAKAAMLRDDVAKAEEYYAEALTIREKLAPNSLDAAATLNDLGDVKVLRGDLAKAEDCFLRSLAISERIAPEGLDAASSLNGLGTVATRARKDLSKAEEYYRQSLAIRERLAPNSLDVAESLKYLGIIAKDRRDFVKAEDYYRRSLAIAEKQVPNTTDFARVLSSYALLAQDVGDFDNAEKRLRQALQIYQTLTPDGRFVYGTLSNLASLETRRREFARAEQYDLEALEFCRRSGQCVEGSLTNLGLASLFRGDRAKAETYFREAVEVSEKSGDMSNAANMLNNLGVAYKSRGDFARAVECYRRSIAMKESLHLEGTFDFTGHLVNLAIAERDQGDFDAAQSHLGRALAIQERLAPLKTGNVLLEFAVLARLRGEYDKSESYLLRSSAVDGSRFSSVLAELGFLAELRGRYDQSLDWLHQALSSLDDQSEPPDLVGHRRLEVLYALGRVSSAKGDKRGAAENFRRAIDSLENQIPHLGGRRELQSGFRARFGQLYADYISTLLALGKPAEAFSALESSRARSLLTMLAEREWASDSELPADIQRARKLNFATDDLIQDQLQYLHPVRNRSQIDQLRSRLRDLADEREQLGTRIRQVSERFGALQYPLPLDLTGTRQGLDPGETLLSYSVGKDKTTLFVVCSGDKPPALSVISLPIGEQRLRTEIGAYRRLILDRRTMSDKDLGGRGRELYDLLVKPAEALLANSNRLLVVSDGPLHSLPFSALIRDHQYLVEWKPVHSVVSATVYAELKKMRRASDKPVELVAFGDPVYPKEDGGASSRTDLDVRATVERGFNLVRLPFSRREVEDIAALYPARNKTFVGSEATEERAKSIGRNVRYIHFAVHAFLDNQFPLDSALALTIPLKKPYGQENGLLQAWEIFEQVRLDADLVTLSACNTAMGQELSGEGMIGLTRAFQYAGARSILSSLWSVDDHWTAELMKRFYTDLKAGKNKDAALQDAQVSLLHGKASSSPAYWAGWSLTGDWQ